MADLLPPVVGVLRGDATHFKREMDQAERHAGGSAKKTEGHFSKLGGAIGTAVKVGTLAAGAAVGGFFVKAIKGASDLNETMGKVNQVFGDSAKQVTGFANDMAKKFGLPKGQILDAAASIGLIGKASGLSQKDAAGMSNQLAKLAADASSFYNVPLPEALDAIKSGLVGEAEPMRRFGVLLSAEAVDAEAAALGLQKRGKGYDEGAKAQARASLIMKGMKDASGDLERTQGNLANRLREVKGRAENFAASVGTKMLPVILKAFDGFEKVGGAAKGLFDIFARGDFTGGIGLEEDSPIVAGLFRLRETILSTLLGVRYWIQDNWPKIRDTIVSVGQSVIAWFQTNWPKIRDTFVAVGQAIQAWLGFAQIVISTWIGVITDLWNRFGRNLFTHLQTAFNAIVQVIQGILSIIRGIFNVFVGIFTGDWSRAWEGVKQIFSGVWNVIVGLAKQFINAISVVIGGTMAAISAAWGAVWNSIQWVVVGIWNGIVSLIRGAVMTILNVIGWFLDGASRIPIIGEPLKAAARSFHTFKDEVNRALGGISDKNVAVKVGVAGVAQAKEVAAWFPGGSRFMAKGGKVPMLAAGGVPPFITDGIRAIVGEGRQAYPEYVLATDPRYSERNQQLWIEYGRRQGLLQGDVPFFAAGGQMGFRASAPGVPATSQKANRETEQKALEVARAWGEEYKRRLIAFLAGGGGGGPVGAGGTIGQGWRAITNYLSSVGVPYTITSTYRPGDPGYHGRGKAVDMVGPMMRIFRALENVRGINELFYSPAGYSIDNGRRAGFLVPGHYDHVHAATFDRGGWLDPGLTLAANNTGRAERVGGPAGVNITVQVIAPTGDVPESTIRKIRDGLVSLGRDMPNLGF